MFVPLAPTKTVLITVNHNAPEATLRFVDSLDRTGNLSQMSVIIADSASTTESLALLRASVAGRINCELLELGENRGYFGAARFALDGYLANGGRVPDWV